MAATDYRKLIEFDDVLFTVEVTDGQRAHIAMLDPQDTVDLFVDAEGLDKVLDALMAAKLTLSP